jgi:hypothetical protein
MTDLGKAGLFAILAFICCVLGILWDIQQIKRQEEAKFAIPIALFASSFICAGVGILLFGDYLLGSL